MSLMRLVGPMRPQFLVLTPVCIFLGLAVAYATAGGVRSVMDAVLVFAGALLAHISVNMLNEYEDFRSGLDFKTEKTPFSGGSGTLPLYPTIAVQTLVLGGLCLAGTVAIGLYLVLRAGTGLVPLGLLGVVIVAGYSPWITRRPLICLAAPGLAFGPLMVMGTDFVLTGSYSATAALVSVTPMLLVSGLLLVNQFPDLEPDREAGRRHLPIVLGRRRAAQVFAAMLLGAFAPILGGVLFGWLPLAALIGLLPLPLAVVVARGAVRHAGDTPLLTPYLGLNVVVIMGTIVLLALGLLLG